MARRRPLVMNGGVIERLQVGDLLTFGKLNLGLFQPLPVISQAATIVSSLHRVTAGGANVDLVTINGGDEGDILVLFGPDVGQVKLKDTGNINFKLNLKMPNHNAIMVYNGSIWYNLASNL